jgi:isocitrate dehydrogenase
MLGKSIARVNRIAGVRSMSSFRKVQVDQPIVDIDGDEMTRVIWQWIKERVSDYCRFC